TVGNQASLVRELAKEVHCREAAAGSQGDEPPTVHKSNRVIKSDEGLSVALLGSGERCFEFFGSAHVEWLKRHSQCPGGRLGLLEEGGMVLDHRISEHGDPGQPRHELA